MQKTDLDSRNYSFPNSHASIRDFLSFILGLIHIESIKQRMKKHSSNKATINDGIYVQ